MDIPSIVLALCAHVEPSGPAPVRPIAWRQTQDGWVIVLEDGRKLRFVREPEPAPAPAGRRHPNKKGE